MRDHPRPELEAVRAIVEQIARGLRAFHRKEILHLDLKPENIMIDRLGAVKIIDFGAARAAGIAEIAASVEGTHFVGTVGYSAPELIQMVQTALAAPGANILVIAADVTRSLSWSAA